MYLSLKLQQNKKKTIGLALLFYFSLIFFPILLHIVIQMIGIRIFFSQFEMSDLTVDSVQKLSRTELKFSDTEE